MRSPIISQVIRRQSSCVPIVWYIFEKHILVFASTPVISCVKAEIINLNLCLALEVANWRATDTFCLPYCVLEKYEYVANV